MVMQYSSFKELSAVSWGSVSFPVEEEAEKATVQQPETVKHLLWGKANLIISCWTHCWAEAENRGCGYTDISLGVGAGLSCSYSYLLLFFSPHCSLSPQQRCVAGGCLLCRITGPVFNLCRFCCSHWAPKISTGGWQKDHRAGAEWRAAGMVRKYCS